MNLEKKIYSLPKEVVSVIKKAKTLADNLGVSSYLVGGFVRDILLKKPNLDVDIVVEAKKTNDLEIDGILFADRLAEIFNIPLSSSKHLVKHKRFGTAVVKLSDKIKVDVATARKELYPKPGALPLVSFGTIYDDLFRRDFSINAMAISLNQKYFGKLIDYFGGIKDLKNKKIRILHNLSFIDDPTRLLRAIRFKERYGFTLERETRRLFNQAKELKVLDNVGKHRVRDELILCLKEAQALKVIRCINKLYGFSFIHKKITLDKKKEKFLKKLDRTIKYFKLRYPQKRALDSWLIFFIALLDGLSLEEVKKIAFDFGFKKGEIKRMLSYFEVHREVLQSLSSKKMRPSLVYQILDPLSFEVIVLIMAKEKRLFVKRRINEFLLFHNGVTLAVSGEDLKKMGFSPGPHFKEILTKTLYAKIDRIIKDKQDEIKFIKEHGSRHIKG
jgi:tRNA nucleotidyltransferase (CCA-adding enzyme)